jgi:hypothetical protein
MSSELGGPAPPVVPGMEAPAPPPAPEPPPAAPAPAPEPPGYAAPTPPGTAPPGPDQAQIEQALALQRALNDPTGAGEAMTRLVQRYGQLPDWFTWDHAIEGMRNYAQYLVESAGVAGGDEEFQGGETVTGGFDPRQMEQLVQRQVTPLQEQIQQLQQERYEMAGQQRAQIVDSAVSNVGQGLNPAAQKTLLNNVVYGLREAMDQGIQIDFRPQAIEAYATEMLTHLRAISTTEGNAAVEAHRGVAPMTRSPVGQPTGTPTATGIQGSAQRALEIARAMNGMR